MATLECKICGGLNEMPAGAALMPCRYCGCPMTLPVMKDESHAAAFNRGNHFRRIGEFDKALAVYERIVQEDETNAEAHWCCALCRFGIEYVQDPATGAYLPTCHRASFDSFLEDVDYLAALEHADESARAQYQQDAGKIAEVLHGILATCQKEPPFDVFICYKETGADGQRTRDSQLAQDIYYQLTDHGLRVFFARITLEDKAGTQYEPYIFAALNSAKVMLVVGTKPEHMSAVWVKNEWSRYLAIMKRDRSRLLIPCYRDMDPYDMPEQLSILQGYDMSRIGFVQDLVRGIRKVVGDAEKPAPAPEPVVVPQPAAPGTEPLLRRAFLFLEDGDWQSADAYCEKVLDADPECARAYVGKLMAALHVTQQGKLPDMDNPFDGDPNYRKALRFADAALKKELQDANAHIRERNENAAKDAAYHKAEQALAAAKTEQDFLNAKARFGALGGWKDAAERAMGCETARKDFLYHRAENALAAAKTEQDFISAKKQFEALGGWRDAAARAQKCETARKDFLYRRAENALAAAKTEPDFIAAKKQFEALGDWRDAPARAQECETKRKDYFYNAAMNLMRGTPSVQTCQQAISLLQNIPDWRDAQQQIEICRQRIPELEAAEQARKEARIAFMRASGRHVIAAGSFHTVGLRAEATSTPSPKKGWLSKLFSIPRPQGPVVAAGSIKAGQCNVDTSSWMDVVAIAASDNHTVGLRADGTVVATGSNEHSECNVNDWKNIVAIAAEYWHTIGLRADGTVVATGSNEHGECNVSDWKNIVAIATGGAHTAGLHADGTVVTVGINANGQCNTSTWSDIVAIAAGGSHTVGLRADGTVVAVGSTSSGRCDTSSWSDIVAIAAGGSRTVGLRADGTVVAVGSNASGQCNTSAWSDIVAIAAGGVHTVGLRADGTVVAVGYNESGQCNVTTWKLKTIPRPTLPE